MCNAARVCRHFTAGIELIDILQGCACVISGQCNAKSASDTGCNGVCFPTSIQHLDIYGHLDGGVESAERSRCRSLSMANQNTSSSI